MHCANLDTLVKGTIPLHQSPQPTAQLTKNMETKEEEDTRMLSMVLDAGILVLEGRLPEQTSKRGYVEGPHCVLYPHTQTHRCDFNSYKCKRAEKYRKFMRSIWNEYKGLCIELRVCADCSCGEEQVWKNTTSRFDYVLEQWYFQITNVRNDDEDIGVMNWYGLLQAIRSQIHFSQLSAWWSSNRATLPKNITYHVLPLIQTDVNSCPLQHKFPVLAFSTTYLQVKVRSQPRSEVLPKIHCPLHRNQDDVLDDRMKIRCDRLGKHHCQALDDVDENDNERWFGDRNKFCCNGLSKSAVDADVFVYEMPAIERPCRERNTPRKPLKKMNADQDMMKVRTSDCCKNKQFLTFRTRPSCSPTSNTNWVSQGKSCVDRVSPQPHEEDQSKFNLNAIHNSLTEETSTQFHNICNWTNTMVSNVVLKMRTGNAFLNNFSDSNPFSELLFNKVEVKPGANCHCDEENRVVVPETKSPEDTSRRNRNTKEERIVDQSRSPVDCGSRCGLKTVNVVSASSSGDVNSKINDTVDVMKIPVSDNNRVGASIEPNMREPLKPLIAIVRERKTEKFKYFNERRSRFEKSRKCLLPFVGNFVESVLSGRVHFTRAIENFKIKITSGGSFTAQNNCTDLPAATYYYHFGDGEVSKSYLVKSFIPEYEKGIQIPATGRLQLGVFNTEDSLIKVFMVSYDLTDMPRCSKTYIRHSNYYTPKSSPEYNFKWLQSFLRLKCSCSKSGRFYLQNEVNVIIFQKSDLNTACEFKMKTDLKHHDVTEIEYKKRTPFNV